MRFLLDTSVVSEPFQRQPDPAILRRLEDCEGECALAAPVWHELLYGLRRLPESRRKAGLAAYLLDVVRPSFPILPYDAAAAEWHGTERARLEARGTPAPFVDSQIAAIARTNGLILVTHNLRHFSRFDGLAIETWANAIEPP